MVKKPTKQAVPNILPRELLTKKARAGTERYVLYNWTFADFRKKCLFAQTFNWLYKGFEAL